MKSGRETGFIKLLGVGSLGGELPCEAGGDFFRVVPGALLSNVLGGNE